MFFYLAEFCNSVIDIREQFPLLPLELSVKISQELEIKHSVNPKSKDLKDNDTAEKLDLERVWWQLQGIKYYIFVMTEQNKIQSSNIQWFTAPYRQGTRFKRELMDKTKSLMNEGTVLIEDLCNEFIKVLEVDHDDALVLLKILLATKQIICDLSKPIAESGILEVVQVTSDSMEQQYAG